MMLKPPMDLATFEAKAGQVADTLKAIGNARRLMLLCKLVEHGEMTVGDLARDVGLSQSACSQPFWMPPITAAAIFTSSLPQAK